MKREVHCFHLKEKDSFVGHLALYTCIDQQENAFLTIEKAIREERWFKLSPMSFKDAEYDESFETCMLDLSYNHKGDVIIEDVEWREVPDDCGRLLHNASFKSSSGKTILTYEELKKDYEIKMKF
jgi:hypothetical protein